MTIVPLGKSAQSTFKYTQLDNPDDVTGMPLRGNLFGINGRIYANLGSYTFTKGDKVYNSLLGKFTEHELRYGCLVRLFELHVHTRTEGDDYDTIKSIDFAPLFEFVKTKGKDFYTIYASYNAPGDGSAPEHHIPLGSKVIFDSCNYASQEIERLKLENMVLTFDPKSMQAFIDIFGGGN